MSQTKDLNNLCSNFVAKISRPVLNLDFVREGIYGESFVNYTESVIENTAHLAGIYDGNKDVTTDAIPSAFRWEGRDVEGGWYAKSAIGKKYLGAVRHTKVAVTIGKGELNLNTVYRTIGKLVYLSLINTFIGDNRLNGKFRGLDTGRQEKYWKEIAE